MALPDLDTSVGHSFGIEIDGVVIKQIQEVSGLKLEQDVIELKQNTADGKYVIKKLPGRFKAGEVTLTRGLTEDNSFEKWIKDSQFGKMADVRKGGAVIVFDLSRRKLVMLASTVSTKSVAVARRLCGPARRMPLR